MPMIIDPSRLRQARERAGLTREALALGVGVGYNAIQAYELGRTDPRAHILIAIARALGVPVEDLCRRDPDAVAGAR